MTLMRRDQTTLSYHEELNLLLQEYDAFHPKFLPVRNRTITQPVHSITNFHYTHIIARNMRSLIHKAEVDLGAAVKCGSIMVPSYGSDLYNFRPFAQFASELAECGSISLSQMPALPRAFMWAYDSNRTDGLQREPGPFRHIKRESLLIEVEPSHVRISLTNVDAKHVAPICAYSCDREGLSVGDVLVRCAERFKEDCLAYDSVYMNRIRMCRAEYRTVKRVFVSGSPERQEDHIKAIIARYFGDNIIAELSFGIDPEILGAYGAARLIRIGAEFPDLRDEESWNEPMFRDPS